MVSGVENYSGTTEVLGLDTPALVGLLELSGLDSEGWRVKESRVKDSPAILEKDIYFEGKRSGIWSFGLLAYFTKTDEPEFTKTGKLRDNYIQRWSRDAVRYLAAFDPFLVELNDAGMANNPASVTQRYRRNVSYFFKTHYKNMRGVPPSSGGAIYSTPFEDGAEVLLKGFALGGARSKIKEVTRSIEIFADRRPERISFAHLLMANENYWVARSNPGNTFTALANAFQGLNIKPGDFNNDVSIGENVCARLNILEGLDEGTVPSCSSGEYSTSFDIAMLHMFGELDERQDVLLKWLVRHMFELYQDSTQVMSLPPPIAAAAEPPPRVASARAARRTRPKIVERPSVSPEPIPERAALPDPPAVRTPAPIQRYERTSAYE